ncbi:ATP-dependent DNA ligase [Solwaraspora sp. WMMA2080]|uniref:DNA polymerase domain-containing protein n=1 Tax=unclassified Solwaraspora TaxID=2627926 RepID=UPI00248C38AF|nr:MULTISPECIES: ATP-dependent DNA ligase [unclassified Solwaraspora]WBB95681.1 ATP-dependent DNA ligase [Solwaraspora sp. WMMA2059]WBC20416.1 ATP-dependent DNA ligase [Solwaraspora sp. WMMA2080]
MPRGAKAGEERAGVPLTNLDQPLFDGAGATKRDLVDYLDAVHDRIVPALRDRPLSVVRVRPGQPPFMQKNLPGYAPDWIATAEVWADRSRRMLTYGLCNDRRTLLWFANQRSVEFHPTLTTAGERAYPTHLILDLDPPPGGAFRLAAQAALLVREVLTSCGMAGAVKTSGAKGAHVFVPLAGDADHADVAAATRAIATRAERLDPALATTAFILEQRDGKVFLDSTRAGGATVVAPYSPRLRPGLPVSFPLTWEALEAAVPTDYTIGTVPSLLGDGDPWATLMPLPQRLDPGLVEQGHGIPIARVVAMHEGKRRAAERRRREAREPDGGPG